MLIVVNSGVLLEILQKAVRFEWNEVQYIRDRMEIALLADNKADWGAA